MRSIVRAEVKELIASVDEYDDVEVIKLNGDFWILLKGVYDPKEDPGVGLYPGWVPFPAGGDFLEMGCGTGIVSVAAARAGCRRVTALDLGPEAVRNARLNAHLHGFLDVVHARESDLFSAVDDDEYFDVIFWNPPYLNPSDDLATDNIHTAFYDPGYLILSRFLDSAWGHLRPGGRLLLGFGSDGDVELLRSVTKRAGIHISTLAESTREYETIQGQVSIDYWLLELTLPRAGNLPPHGI
ncbi:methyltransferase [Lipingzhangella sp. LS1_29]|uniref:Methyltransferase n=1 Tax=Lipingzhangella rawalii TaxID=2055835 RepID=A0ABU2H8A8_9ACTN|nr:methyltransferase [Lipingzhangella rawalii]MDS1271541.1 methyltransferase [Lipingzhangella rawalii]